MKKPSLLPSRQIGLAINDRQDEKLRALAKKAGIPFLSYCQMLFDAAYAAKVGICYGDEHLDQQIRIALILFGAGLAEERIAEVIGVSTGTVRRIVIALRDEILARRAA